MVGTQRYTYNLHSLTYKVQYCLTKIILVAYNRVYFLLQFTRVRLNLVRDTRRELEQRWSPEEKAPLGPASPLNALLLCL